jgi:hypothetical protein
MPPKPIWTRRCGSIAQPVIVSTRAPRLAYSASWREGSKASPRPCRCYRRARRCCGRSTIRSSLPICYASKCELRWMQVSKNSRELRWPR